MANLSAIKLPNGVTYTLKDNGALQLTGGQVTGPVTFGDSVSIDDLTAGQLVVNGSASFTNGAHGVIDKAKAADVTSTLNALVKYEDTEGTFSDSNIYNTSNNLIIGSTSVPGNIQIGAKNDNYGILPNTNNYNQIGSGSLYWYRAYINNYYGLNSHVTNWDAGKNIGTASTSSAAATLGSVYFYNACAAGSTQTKTLLSNGSATSNITVTLPNTTGTLALTSQIPDISGKADKSATVSNVAYDSTNAKITKTINGTTSDVVTVATLKTALGSMPASDVYSWAKASTKPTYTASEVGALPSNHTYATSIATSTATNQITLAYGTKYALTAGGTSYVFTMPSADDTNTWRTIQVNGTDVLGSGTSTGKLNLKAGTGITVTNSSGTVTIASTITDTNTHRPIQMNGTEILGNNTTALNLKAGTNVSLSNSSGTVTISSTDTNTWRGIQDNLTSTSTTESLSANQGRLLKNTKAEYRSIGSCADYQRVVIGLCELSANANSGTSSHTSGSIVSIRSNGLVPEYVSQFVFQDDYSTAKACNYSFIGNFENTSTTLRAGEGFRACTFTYNSKYYAGLEFYQTQARSFYWYGEGNFEPFLVAYYNFNTSAVLNSEINNSISLSTTVLKRRNITVDVAKTANSVAWGNVSSKPTATGSKVTGITASTTATKTTLGTAFTIPNVTSAGSASTWAFEEISIPNVTAAGSASSWTFEEKTIPNVTSAGSASTWAFTGVTVVNSISGAIDANDSTQLNITAGTTTVQSKSSGGNGTAPTLGTAIKVQSKSGGSNGSAPTLGTAIKVQSKKSGANGSAPTLGTAFTVPNVTGNTSATVSITDPGHTHSI